MKSLVIALALSAAPARAADPSQWLEWRAQDEAAVAQVLDRAPGTSIEAQAHKASADIRAVIARWERVVWDAQAQHKAAVLSAVSAGRLDPEEARRERERIDRAAEIHLAYLHGSVHKRILNDIFGYDFPWIKELCAVQFGRANYAAALAQDPIRQAWGGWNGQRGNLSTPAAANGDGQ